MKRIYHTWNEWECYPAGFYDSKHAVFSDDECREMYRDFLRDTNLFSIGLARVLTEWTNSCEHYLSNESMNRIAWLGQASVCLMLGIPSRFRGGFNMLNKDEQLIVNQTALVALNAWLVSHREDAHWAPSYRRLCKVLLRNDHWCKGLGLTQPKSEAYQKYLELRKKK